MMKLSHACVSLMHKIQTISVPCQSFKSFSVHYSMDVNVGDKLILNGRFRSARPSSKNKCHISTFSTIQYVDALSVQEAVLHL